MGVQRLAPDAIASRSNLSGPLADVQDDPDAPDGLWWTANNDANDTDARVRFPTPTRVPLVGVGLQEFRVQVRSTGPGANPTVRLEIWESGTLRAAGPNVAVTSTVSQVVAFTWNANLLADPSGADVECRVFGDSAGVIILDPFDTVEIGAIEWNSAHALLATAHAGSFGVSGAASGDLAAASGPFGSIGLSGRADGTAAVLDATFEGTFGVSGVMPSAAVRESCPDGPEKLAPDAILELENLVGVVSEIQDDPDAPDDDWLDASLPIFGTAARVSFPTPSVPLSDASFVFRDELVADSFDRPDLPCAMGTTPLVTDTGDLYVSHGGGVGIDSGKAFACVAGSPAPVLNGALVGVGPVFRRVGATVTVSSAIGTGGFNRVFAGLSVARSAANLINVVLRGFSSGPFAGPGIYVVVGAAAGVGIPNDVAVLTDVVPGSTHTLEADLLPDGIHAYLDGSEVLFVPLSPTQVSLALSWEQTGFHWRLNSSPSFNGDDGDSRIDDFFVETINVLPVAQEFRARVRPTFLLPIPPLLLPPTVRLELWEDGSFVSSSPEFGLFSEQVVSWSWDPSSLSDPTGAAVECRVVGSASVLDLVGWTVEVGAVEWVVPQLGSCTISGSLGTSAVLSGSKDAAGGGGSTWGLSGAATAELVDRIGLPIYASLGVIGRARPPEPAVDPGLRRCEVGPGSSRSCDVAEGSFRACS